jgi:hypothetical protein
MLKQSERIKHQEIHATVLAEVAALQIPDVQDSARRGLLIIRHGKGLMMTLPV